MVGLAVVSASRLASLASGRGGWPAADEWPFVLLVFVAFAAFGTLFLRSSGLTTLESLLVAGVSPPLVLLDVSLGHVGDGVALAANAAGCLVPVAVGAKVLAERRAPWLEAFVVLAVGVAASYYASEVVPSRGVMLQYRIPSIVVGFVAASLFHRKPEVAGAIGFAGGGLGVLIGADVLRLGDLAVAGGSGRVILGGAGLLDGIFLVAFLSAILASSVSAVLRGALRARSPAGAA